VLPPPGVLECPLCRAVLVHAGGTLRCERGHAFDIARQGYVNLLGGGAVAGTGDTSEMVAAREVFLGAEHYAHIAAALAGAVERAVVPIDIRVLDVGAGTGYYLAAVLDSLPNAVGVALDISKHAARRAARSHARASAIVCDAWDRFPIMSASVTVVLSVFAPRNAAEFARVVEPGGIVATVTPTQRHLAELVGALGLLTVDSRKEERLASTLGEHFSRESSRIVEAPLTLDHADVSALVGMGPSAHHLTPAERDTRIAELPDPVGVTSSATVTVWRRCGS